MSIFPVLVYERVEVREFMALQKANDKGSSQKIVWGSEGSEGSEDNERLTNAESPVLHSIVLLSSKSNSLVSKVRDLICRDSSTAVGEVNLRKPDEHSSFIGEEGIYLGNFLWSRRQKNLQDDEEEVVITEAQNYE
ncbi:hypothetical protein VTL71DRAFT_4010, partial [Oculimacula yallundae]